MYYIFAILFILLSAFEGFFKGFKGRYVFFGIAGFFLIIIQCFNTWSPDLENYQIHFELIENKYVRIVLEPLHIFIIEQLKNIGASFHTFIAIYGLLIMFPFLYFIKKSSPLPVFVLMVFFFIPFFPDIVQLRNFLSLSLFFIAIYFFEKKIILSIFLVLAVLEHYSALILIVFFLVRKTNLLKNYKSCNIVIILGMALLMVVPRQISESVVVAINPKYGSYLEGTTTYLGTVALFLPFFLLNNFVLYHYNNYYSYIEDRVAEKYKRQIPLFIELIQYANYLILIQYFIRDFSRITMNLSILSYIYISIILYYGWSKNSNELKQLLLRYSVLIWALITFVIVFLVLNEGEYMRIIEKTFSSNILYGE